MLMTAYVTEYGSISAISLQHVIETCGEGYERCAVGMLKSVCCAIFMACIVRALLRRLNLLVL